MALGTELENRAGIYFDFNVPVTTNTAFHVLGEDLVLDTNQPNRNWDSEVNVIIHPQPLTDNALIVIENMENQDVEFQLFTPVGQLIKTVTIVDGKGELRKGNLAAGVYFYKLSTDDKQLKSGKLIVH